jgi:hypothetical protein
VNVPMSVLKALVLDFDSTISTPTFIKRVGQWAVADKIDVFNSMNTEEIAENFGGAQRIAVLSTLLAELRDAGIILHIVSIGYKAAFIPHLETVGLLHFFHPANIFGQDSVELQEVGFVKAAMISKLMTSAGWSHDELLFVDDSESHIEKAASVCASFLVSHESKSTVGGMAACEFEVIRKAAALPSRDMAGVTMSGTSPKSS